MNNRKDNIQGWEYITVIWGAIVWPYTLGLIVGELYKKIVDN